LWIETARAWLLPARVGERCWSRKRCPKSAHQNEKTCNSRLELLKHGSIATAVFVIGGKIFSTFASTSLQPFHVFQLFRYSSRLKYDITRITRTAGANQEETTDDSWTFNGIVTDALYNLVSLFRLLGTMSLTITSRFLLELLLAHTNGAKLDILRLGTRSVDESVGSLLLADLCSMALA
jgi:hypothetical protein